MKDSDKKRKKKSKSDKLPKWHKRFSGFDLRMTDCQWCLQFLPTTVNEVWSEADPAGHLVRLCQGCAESCAGG